MKRGGAWLSRDVGVLAREQEARGAPPCFDVVVVGSGYGGAVAAARLSALAAADGRPLSVCVLERGLEYPPGSFPAGFSEVLGHQRVSGTPPAGGQSLPEGLMDWHVGGDVWALVANGVGGGSLINAGVCAPAQDVVLDRAGWPDPWRGNRARWQALYRRASAALGAEAWPARRVPRQFAMERLARESGGTCVPVAVTIAPPGSAPVAGDDATVAQNPCVECGDCFTGCNVGAKRTLVHTYLSRAHRQGAALYSGATVRSVAPLADADADAPRWEVRYLLTDPLLLPGRAEPFALRARHVVLAAGTFGSTEILMRSRGPGFEVSGRLGEGFSANGDILSAFYDTGAEVRPSPDETRPPDERGAGPTITSQIEWPAADDAAGRPGAPRDVMQDLGVPGALGWVFREVLATMMVPQRWTRFDWRTRRPGDPDPFAVDEAATARSLLTVSYADDGAAGRLAPGPGWSGLARDGAVVVRWPRPAQDDWFRRADARLAERRPGGSFLLRNPLTQFMPEADYLGIRQTGSRLLTVHPLGGCRMGESADDGVVDAFGRVYDTGLDLAERGDPATERRRARHDHRLAHALHEGLHVLDGSIVPTSLGINPLLTITALAEGAIDQWILAYGWTTAVLASRPLPPPPDREAPVAAPSPTAVRFGERMTGPLRPWRPLADPEVRLHLSMRADFERVDDLREFLARPEKTVRVVGTFAVDRRRAGTPRAAFPPDAPGAPPPLPPLAGTVRWLRTERSHVLQRVWRSAATYLRQRNAADRAAAAAARRAGRSSGRPGWSALLRAATHFGAVRQLAYEFEPLAAPWHLMDDPRLGQLILPAGTVLRGTKRLGYLQTDPRDPESANPWHQLSYLGLEARLPGGGTIALGTLEFDPMAMLDRYDMPLAVAGQGDMLCGLRDLGSLALYMGRLMFGLHMLTFRRPDYPVEERGRRELMRLPPPGYAADGRGYEALAVEAFDVPQVLPGGETIRLRLTRLRHRDATAPGLPVVVVHGFGSGGIQFTHPAIATPLAPWLALTRGCDVWVAELRTSIGLETAARQWVMDDVALQDVPRLIEAVCERTGSARVQVVAHCIGSAMVGMATLAGRLRHGGVSRVAGAVLMQVGPCAVLPRANRARAYVALRLQQLLGADRVGSVASQDPDDAEAMLDRVLGTLLYPRDQRAHYRLTGDHARNVRRTNANRSAGTFGQLFQYENMTGEVLDVMEDLLGDCNLTTYAQTAIYAFGGRLSDQRGDDAYVTDERMTAFFDFPVLYLHGRRNRTFDRRTFDHNVRLARRLGLAFHEHAVPGYGHLDCVVGRDTATRVLPFVAEHLERQRHDAGGGTPPPTPASGATPPTASPFEPRLSAVGPWIGDAVAEAGALRLRIGLRFDDLGRSLRGVVATTDADAGFACLGPPGTVALRQEFIADLRIAPAVLAPYLAPGAGADAVTRVLEVLVSPVHHALPADGAEFRTRVRATAAALAREAQRRGVPAAAVAGLRLDAGWIARLFDAAPRDLGLVLGACRQRPLLVDREMADRAMRHVHDRLGDDAAPPAGHAPIDALVLAGDQIYGDSRADASHPATSGGRFFDAHREAWTAPWQREVMRRRPTYLVVDDHEFRNDYNDRVAAGRPREFAAAREAWNAYQRDAGPPPPAAAAGDPAAAWRHLRLRGFGVFLTDTRSERGDVTTVGRRGARIMGAAQMAALQDWLLRLHLDPAQGRRAKIVVTASPVAPLFAGGAGAGATGVADLQGDGWQRFPDSLGELLAWIGRHEIDGVVFLSGDYHRHARCTLRVRAEGRREVTATSIVTGGLYAPYPFANATRDEWLEPAPLSLALPGQPGVAWSYAIDADAGGDGYTRLTFGADGRLACDWVAMPSVLPPEPAPWPPPSPP